MKREHVLVAGAGMVGVSAAIWLQRAGYRVTLVDRRGPAGGASYGNAGVLAAGAVVPVTVPGLWKKAPAMLLDPDAPLFLRWSYLPKLLPFLRKYLAACTDRQVRAYAAAMSALLLDSVAQHLALAEGTGAQEFIGNEDFCFGYRTRREFEEEAYSWRLRENCGVAFETLSGGQYAEYDPVFAGMFDTVVCCKNHGRISDPGAYIETLAAHFTARGGAWETASVCDIVRKGNRATGLATDCGVIGGDQIILATGAWSKPLLAKLGLAVPLESERGYHIELVNPSAMPKAPMMVCAGKFVVTPMRGRIRCAGVTEFGGLGERRSKAPLAMLKRSKLLRNVRYERIDEWLGHRPAPANSLPLIGPVGAPENVYAGIGHQHVGLTAGAKTGRMLAAWVCGDGAGMDPGLFDPRRYRTKHAHRRHFSRESGGE